MKNVMKFAIVALLSMMTTGVFATGKHNRHIKAQKPVIAQIKQESKAKTETKKEEKKEAYEKKEASEKKEALAKHTGEKRTHKKHSKK
jgi:hypothetical protein